MDVSHILDPLNEAQREAVSAQDKNLLIVAGAGSGKTRVLTHRIAWLVQVEGVSPYSILAVTFTNKAAAEMRGRIEKLMGTPAGGMWVGTFHGIAHRLLRAHWQEANLPKTFQILDSDDQYRMIRRILKSLELDESQYAPREAQWFINAKKDEGLRAAKLNDNGDHHLHQLIRIYKVYEEQCQRGGMVDFAELLLRTHELLKNVPSVLDHYRHRFSKILVDEFQDTNTIQYSLLRLLAGNESNMFAVGDDDQSIYGWRGAKIENIHQYNSDFESVRTVRLEQNYRSTKNILAASNALIANNAERLGKELWTDGREGDLISLYTAFNELDEANFVVQQIIKWVEEGNPRNESAILYRSNAQSRVFEESLLRQQIPYRVYGGLRFFERMEIKDALAYMRLVANCDDDASFERVINTPTRGIGQRTLETIRATASQNKMPLWQASVIVMENKLLPARAANALHAFLVMMNEMATGCEKLSLHELTEHVIEHSGLKEHYKKEKGEKGRARIENLDELITAARSFVQNEEEGDLDPLSAFLSHASLEAGEQQGNEWDDCVQLMTLHSAKGLEFDTVFLCGVEEGLFPHQRSVDEPGRLEEERRLCYVGMTRAKKHLYISHAEMRRLHGSDNYCTPSRFVNEIPKEYINEVRPMTSLIQSYSHKPRQKSQPAVKIETEITDGLKLGQRVAHTKFGEGVVVNYEGHGSHARIQVNFDYSGSKWLVAAYANLESV